jgi:hypothetical protein
VKELKVLKVTCADCGQLNLIPMPVAADRGEPIGAGSAEGCS